MTTITVSQLNRYIKAVFDEDRKLSDLYVKGEISNFTDHYQSGHCYFSLKDKQSAIRAVMFKSYAQDLRFAPENGMAVLVQASVSVFERDGTYQLYVTDMQPDGAGALAVAFEQCKTRLAARGLFDVQHKKPLPSYPDKIGVITSHTGAVLQDIVNVITRRYPLGKLVLCPATVQGAAAVSSIILALQALDKSSCDVIIIARGGGSLEDLWCFNDETLAEAVFAAKTPVISAVGHETDYTICDFVADVRAPTPSAAAELATPSAETLAHRLASVQEYFSRNAAMLWTRQKNRLRQLVRHRALQSPIQYVEKKQQRLDFWTDSLYNKKWLLMRDFSQRLAAKAALLDSMSPLRVLDRGYCVTSKDGKAVSSACILQKDDIISVRFRDGTVLSTVREIQGEERT